MNAKRIVFICIAGLIVFAILTVVEFAGMGNTVQKTMQAVKNTIKRDTLVQRLRTENVRLASEEIADQIVSKLPDDIHLRLLAIGPISGESDSLVDALTAKIKSQTSYHLIERKDLSQLLAEQGIQLSPVADARQPIEPGRIKGVEGLILGRLETKHASFAGCSMTAFIKLDNVEGGDVIFAETFTARHLPTHTIYGAITIIFLILLIFCANRLKVRSKNRRYRRVGDDGDRLLLLQDSLKKTRENLNRAHDGLVTRGRMDAGMAVRKCRDDVRNLLDMIEHTPGLHPESVTTSTYKDAKSHTRSMGNLVKNLLAESEKLVKAAEAADGSRTLSIAKNFQMEAKNALNRFTDRTAGIS